MDQNVVDRLFRRLQATFPKWREIWRDDKELKAAKKQWTRTIVKRGLADPQILKLGIEKAELTGWVRPPSPGQFCDWCLDGAKELAGIPSREDAVDEIMRIASKNDDDRYRTRMSPPIYQTCRFIDWFSLRRKKIEDAEKAIGTAYDKMIKHWMAGKPFEEQPQAIEHKKPIGDITPESREKGKEALRELLKELG